VEAEPSQSLNYSLKVKIISSIVLLLLLAAGASGAKSNSKGVDSPLAIGTITAISADGKTLTILQGGEHKRDLVISGRTELIFVGMPKSARRLAVGHGVKASVKGGSVKSVKVTLPIGQAASLGKDRTKLSVNQILAKANENGDGGLDYVEVSRWIHHSPKHGPDSFLKADKNDDGLLDGAEMTKLLAGVSWWEYSRKSSDEWFRQADANGDGVLDLKEFTTIAAGKNHAENVFKRTDKNKDKALDPKEVAKYVDQLIGSTH
jgi:Ca2+-binding EF-hand superfamily protein